MFPENHEEDVALYMSSVDGITFNKVPPIKDIRPIETPKITISEKGVEELLTKGVIRRVLADDNIPLLATARILIKKVEKPKFLINKGKRTLVLLYHNEKIVIKPHEEDKFDWKIGLGLALSNANAININKAKAHRNIWFRNKKTHKLDYKKYANWVLTEYYHNDMEDLYNLEQRVKKAKDKEFIEL